jgi:hypothetical protein
MPIGFRFVKRNANAAIVRVGSTAGLIKLSPRFDLSTLNKNTHYFLRVDDYVTPLLNEVGSVTIENAS